jgi:hypothetical protein
MRSRDSSVVIQQLIGRGAKARYFALLHRVQTDFGTRPASYKMGTGGSSPGAKRHGRESDLSPPSGAEVKNGRAILPYVFMALYLMN